MPRPSPPRILKQIAWADAILQRPDNPTDSVTDPMPDAKPLEDKVALITGAASGIGAGIATAYAAAGAIVAAVDVDEAGLAATVQRLTDDAYTAAGFAADVSRRAQVERTVQEVVERFGRIDVLVNCAGVLDFSPILDVDEALFDRAFGINVKGYLFFAQAVARQMIARGGGGAMVNITSISAEHCGALKVHYCMTNAARKMLTKGLALELAEHGIRVNAVAPGDIESNIVHDPKVQRLLDTVDFGAFTPLGRRGRPEDIGGACVFLASDAASYITGATILIDGGAASGSFFPDPPDAPEAPEPPEAAEALDADD